jgi:hypothetical protein
MRPIAFAAAQLNIALRDSSLSPIPAVPSNGSGLSAAGSGEPDANKPLNDSSLAG